MTNREIDALVADKVMGWGKYEFDDLGRQILDRGYHPDDARIWLPQFTTNPKDDYIVLRHVREAWSLNDYDRFVDKVADICASHRSALPYPNPKLGNILMFYEPGDYSRAALAALGISIDGKETGEG